MTKKSDDIIQELFKTRHKFWNIHPDSSKIIVDLIEFHKPQKILEIGTSNGLSSIIMGSIAATYGGSITTIEYYEDRVKTARDNIKKAGLEETVNVVLGDALKIIPEISGKWDFVFLDGGKQDYIAYYNLLSNKLSKNGILVADNTVSHRNQMEDFFDAIYKDERFKIEEYNVGQGLLVAYLRS